MAHSGASKKHKGPRPRRVPQRSCVACRQVKPKRGLIRIVRAVSGEVVIDRTGKKSGRGAYLCYNPSCWRLALQKKSLDHALRTTLGPEARKMLQEFASSLKEVGDQSDQ